ASLRCRIQPGRRRSNLAHASGWRTRLIDTAYLQSLLDYGGDIVLDPNMTYEVDATLCLRKNRTRLLGQRSVPTEIGVDLPVAPSIIWRGTGLGPILAIAPVGTGKGIGCTVKGVELDGGSNWQGLIGISLGSAIADG